MEQRPEAQLRAEPPQEELRRVERLPERLQQAGSLAAPQQAGLQPEVRLPETPQRVAFLAEPRLAELQLVELQLVAPPPEEEKQAVVRMPQKPLRALLREPLRQALLLQKQTSTESTKNSLDEMLIQVVRLSTRPPISLPIRLQRTSRTLLSTRPR